MTTCGAAIKNFEAKTGEVAAEAAPTQSTLKLS